LNTCIFRLKFIPLCSVDVATMLSGYSILWEYSSSKHGRSGLDAGFGQESGKSSHQVVAGMDFLCGLFYYVHSTFLGHCILWNYFCSIDLS